jgi:AcrR family transcriptional regulator
MKSAGLTHGAFYGHFASKHDLMAQASANALARSLEDWLRDATKHPGHPLAAIVASYLSAGIATTARTAAFLPHSERKPCVRTSPYAAL